MDRATRGLENAPSYGQVHALLVAAVGQLGPLGEAKHHVEELLARRPALTVEELQPRMGGGSGSDVERYLEGLVNAGLSAAD